ncbi:tol-pal system YbgF family protein [Corallococcus exercitus]|uniref:tol-pal system YbgF family protein n=1 Tax=Corallococcus exercitus TaxID=2316736 RepID=UPI0035D43C9F
MPDAEGAVPPEVEAKELMDRARGHMRSGDVEEAIPLCDAVYRRFTLSKSPALQLQVARALSHRGAAIAEQGMFQEALVHFDEVERRFWSPRRPELWEGVAWGMLYRARVLLEMDQEPMCSNWLERMLSRFGTFSQRSDLRVPVEMARTAVLAAHNQAERFEESLSLSEALLKEYDGQADPFLVEQTAVALLQRAIALQGLGHVDEALEAFDEVDVRYCEDTDPRLRALVSTALMGRAIVLLREEFLPEALSALDAILEHAGPNPGRRLLESVNFAKFHHEVIERQMQLERERTARGPKPRAVSKPRPR